jgi:lipopolysaccharide transport system ATP-binding protein
MVGTFDLENLGDLLFPFVAEHELSRRLGSVELELFSYRAVDPPAWPLKVRPVHTLAARVAEFDLVLVGGGHLVRGDQDVAPGYAPTDGRTPHPLGLWLVPTLVAGAAGVPVAWNAVGTIDTVPDAVAPLVDAALECVDHLAVRDPEAARFVRARAPAVTPLGVPDTVFGVVGLLDDDVWTAARDALAALGVDGGYVVVQPSPLLEDHRDAVEALARAAASEGLAVVELAVGPCHLDAPGRLGLRTPTVAVAPWPAPLVSAAILAGADAVVAASLHAGVIATAAGVPLYRPRAALGSKHEVLDLLPGVRALPADGREADLDTAFDTAFGRGPVAAQLQALAAMLEHHWDAIAALARRERAGRSPRPAVATLLTTLPDELVRREAAAAEQLDRRAASAAEERDRHAAAVSALGSANATLADVNRDLVTKNGALVDEVAALTEERDAARARLAAAEAQLERASVRAARRVADAASTVARAPRKGSPPGR